MYPSMATSRASSSRRWPARPSRIWPHPVVACAVSTVTIARVRAARFMVVVVTFTSEAPSRVSRGAGLYQLRERENWIRTRRCHSDANPGRERTGGAILAVRRGERERRIDARTTWLDVQ